MENIYYVYRWIRLDSNTPFYIGKGYGSRFQRTKSGRNKYFRNILKTTHCEVEILVDNLTEEQAFQKEIEFIKLYKELGYCEANLTNGGEGSSGYRFTTEQRKKLSIDRKGRKLSDAAKEKVANFQKGRKRSEETKIRMSLARRGENASWFGIQSDKHPRARKVIDTATGHIFGCLKNAANFIQIKYTTLRAMLNGQNPNRTTLRYI